MSVPTFRSHLRVQAGFPLQHVGKLSVFVRLVLQSGNLQFPPFRAVPVTRRIRLSLFRLTVEALGVRPAIRRHPLKLRHWPSTL